MAGQQIPDLQHSWVGETLSLQGGTSLAFSGREPTPAGFTSAHQGPPHLEQRLLLKLYAAHTGCGPASDASQSKGLLLSLSNVEI